MQRLLDRLVCEQPEDFNAEKVVHCSRINDRVDADQGRERREDSPPPKRLCLRQADVSSESQRLLQQLITKVSRLVHTEPTKSMEDLGITIA